MGKGYRVNQRTVESKAIPVQIPVGEEDKFEGIIDLISENSSLSGDHGEKINIGEIPDSERKSEKYREEMMDMVASEDDELMEKYLAGSVLDGRPKTIVEKIHHRWHR